MTALPSIYDLFTDRKKRPTTAPAPAAVPAHVEGLHPYAAAAVAAELHRLDTLPRPWREKESHWDTTTYEVACNLLELANSPWSGYSVAQAKADLLRHAPADEVWGRREHEQKWESAVKTVGTSGRPEPTGVELPPTTVLDTAQEEAPTSTLASRMVDGGSFILDTPATVPAVWGNGSEVLWSEGESCIIAGPPGVGKTTITGQIVRALIGLDDQVLGYSVQPAPRRVLYLAMDRPRQIARALARHFTTDERPVLDDKLRVWPGPPPADIAKNPGLIAALAEEADASVVIIDSLKDAALGLSEDEVGAAYNRARQTALAAGVEVLELHHVVKRGPNGAKPTTLADLYGSAWITAGAGSVILLWGAAGDPIVDLTHLKQPAEPVGPLRVIHDHATGTSSVWQSTDPLAMVQLAGTAGVTAQRLACAMFETDKPDRNEIEKARRRLDKLVRDGLAEAVEGPAPGGGGKAPTVYRAITHPITHVIEREAITDHSRNHDPGITAGQAITEARTALTRPSTHDPTPPFKGGGSGAPTCTVCKKPMTYDDGTGTHPTCTPTEGAA